jgi:uncharacterized protein YoxC
MANPDLTAGQVDTLAAAIQGLQEALDAMNKSARRAGASLSQQGEISANATSSITDNANALDRLEDALNGMSGAQRRAATETQNSKDQFSSLEAQINSLTTAEERNAAAKQSMVEGLTRVFAGLKLFGGFIGSAISGIFSLGKAIFLLPFRLLSGLVEFASEGGGGNALREAYEDVRKVFGDLASGSAKDLINSFQGVRQESNNLAGSGIRLSRIFGVGPSGLAAAIGFIRETAESLGAQFQLLRDTFVDSAAELIVFQKGLGLSNEQFKAFTTDTIARGGDLIESLHGIANLAVQLGDQFNISAKEIARDMATLSKDFITFGHLSQQELASTATFARLAGVEIDSLTKIAEKFKTFESAAESAAMLNQALGIQIDAMEMLTASSPADQLKQLQDAFRATGRSITDLNRAERELLATHTNLSGEELAAAFAPENAGRSIEEIRAIAAEAAASPISTEEAMTRLASSIERVFETGGGMRGFFDAFSQGFEQGLRWFGPTRELFRNIRLSLQTTRNAGREFARTFIQFFPGITDVVIALRDAFEPAKFRRFLGGINLAFKDFFKSLDPTNPGSGVSTLLSKFQSVFFETFGGEGGGEIFSQLSAGLSKIGTFLYSVLLGALPYITDALVYLIDQITLILRGEGQSEIGEAFNGVFESLGEAFSAAWDQLSPVLYESGMKLMQSLGPALWEGLTWLYDNVIEPYWHYALGAMLLLFAPQLVSGLLLQIVGLAISAVISTISGIFGSISALASGTTVSFLGSIETMIDQIGKIIDKISKINLSNIGKAMFSLVKLAVFATVGLAAFIGGLSAVFLIASASGLIANPEQTYAFLAVAAFTVLAAAGLIAAGSALAGLSAGIGPAIVGLLAAAVLMTVGLAAIIGALWVTQSLWDGSGLDAKKITDMFLALGIALVVTGALIIGTAAFGALLLSGPVGLLFGAAFIAGLTTIAGILVTTAEILVPAIAQIINAMSNADPARARLSLELLTGVMEAMSPITDIATAAMGIQGARPDEIARVLDAVGRMTVQMLESMSGFITSIVNLLNGPGLSEEQIRMASAIGTVLGAVSGLLDTFSGPLQTIDETIDQGFFTDTTERSETIYASIQARVDGVSNLIKGLVDSGALRDLSRAIVQMGQLDITEEGLKKVEAIFGLLKSVGDVIKTFSSQGSDGAQQFLRSDQVDFIFQSYSLTLALMANTIRTTLRPLIDNIITSMAGLDAEAMENSLELFGTFFESIDRVFTKIKNISDSIGDINISGTFAKFSELNTAIEGFNIGQVETTINTFSGIVEAYNDFYDSISDLGEIDINAAIQRLGSSLGIRNQEVTVRNEPINVTINLNVTMDADEIATTLTSNTLRRPLLARPTQ